MFPNHTPPQRISSIFGTLFLLISICTGCATPPAEYDRTLPIKEYKTNPSLALVNPVIYRIDGHRYFILETGTDMECANGTIYYIDTKLGIKSAAGSSAHSYSGGIKFTIDAANDLYLAAPVHGGGGEGSGGSSGGEYAYYSTDAGRTWKVQNYSPTNNTIVTGNMYYSYGYDDHKLDRTNGYFFDMSASKKYLPEFWIEYHNGDGNTWTEADYPALQDEKYASSDGAILMRKELAIRKGTNPPKIRSAPHPRIQPIDSGFHCVAQPIVGHE